MKKPSVRALLLALGVLVQRCGPSPGPPGGEAGAFPVPRIAYAPKSYVCYRAAEGLHIDGKLHEPAWEQASWTADFVDIEGEVRPVPRYRTRAKLLWDNEFLYIGARMQEPDLWARLSQRDTVVFYDHDFEVFIDPDGDTQNYYELEMNARNTVWDLLLIKPYRDGGPAIHAWDIRGLRTAVALQGTLNQPADVDSGWSVEIALPWEILKEGAPNGAPPQPGAQWRLNFSRVEWRLDKVNGHYEKRRDAATGAVLPEDNWVWSPQGLINMHYPEMWGYVQFSGAVAGTAQESFQMPAAAAGEWALRQIYYQQKTFFRRRGAYARSVAELGLLRTAVPGYRWPPRIHAGWEQYEAILAASDGRTVLLIDQDGRIHERPAP